MVVTRPPVQTAPQRRVGKGQVDRSAGQVRWAVWSVVKEELQRDPESGLCLFVAFLQLFCAASTFHAFPHQDTGGLVLPSVCAAMQVDVLQVVVGTAVAAVTWVVYKVRRSRGVAARST